MSIRCSLKFDIWNWRGRMFSLQISYEDVNLGLLPFLPSGARISSHIKSTGLIGKCQKISFGPLGPTVPEVYLYIMKVSQILSFVVVVLKVIWVGSLVAASARHGFNPWVRKIPWRRKWQPTPVWSPGKCHRQRSLVSYSLWKESDTKSRAQRVGHGWATEQAYTHAL